MTYAQRVEALEAEGLTRSDAQAAVEAEDIKAVKAHKHYELARRAHYNTSFTPEKRAEAFCKGFDADIKALQELGIEQAKIDRYEALVIRHMQVKSRCLSSMITGPANFPTARAEKANRAEHNASLAASEYYNRIVKQAKQDAYYAEHPEARPVMSGDADALDRLKSKLEAYTKSHERMIEANKLVRKGDVDGLRALLPQYENVEKLLKPDFCGRVGFADYALNNSRAEIKRIEGRIKQIEQRKASTPKDFVINGVRVVENTEAMRLQLFFEGKPKPEVISMLKRNGMKWAPSVKAWQRQLTNNALWSFNHYIMPELHKLTA